MTVKELIKELLDIGKLDAKVGIDVTFDGVLEEEEGLELERVEAPTYAEDYVLLYLRKDA